MACSACSGLYSTKCHQSMHLAGDEGSCWSLAGDGSQEPSASAVSKAEMAGWAKTPVPTRSLRVNTQALLSA